jgi:hypothetical protein
MKQSCGLLGPRLKVAVLVRGGLGRVLGAFQELEIRVF